MPKIIKTIPIWKVILWEIKKVWNQLKYQNYSWFIAIFIYTNIALYFCFWFSLIFWL